MSHAFCPVEVKEDSAEKLAYAAGKPTSNFLFSYELNMIVGCLNMLRGMIVLTGDAIDRIIAGGVSVVIPPGDTTVVESINTLSDPVSLGNGVTFVTYFQSGIRKVFWFKGAPGDYGATAETISDDDLELLYSADVNVPGIQSFRGIAKWIGTEAEGNLSITVHKNDFSASVQISGSAGGFELVFLDGSGLPIPIPLTTTAMPSLSKVSEDSYANYAPNLGALTVGFSPTIDLTGSPELYFEMPIFIDFEPNE